MDMGSTPSARAVKRIEDVRQLRQLQFPEDAGPMAHPVRPDSYVEINNFYTPTVYEKGAEVVRMMHTLVGREGFAKGMSLYFERFDGQAVTCDDFAQAIADANPASELAQHLEQFKRWYSQAGTPRLEARGRYDTRTRSYTIGIEQSCPATKGSADKLPYVIPLAIGLVARDGSALPLQLEDEPETTRTERVLVLRDVRSFFTFVNVDSEPVPSLLRGFSAPVCLVDGLHDAELLTLLNHDSDAFNRWNAGQRLALNRLLPAVRDAQPVELDDAFVDAMRSVLRHPELDPAFKELVLRLPGESYIAEQMSAVDPQAIHRAREDMRLQLARVLRNDWEWAFDAHRENGAYSPNPLAAGRRALANLALSMLCLDAADSGDAVWPQQAFQRSKDAGNMTDREGAVVALLGAASPLAQAALDDFYARFRMEPLVIDKWFSLQAAAPDRDGNVLARVNALRGHPDFSLANPNRARSLVLALCSNPAAFHRADGAGYAFWADRVLDLDAANPQLASRIARQLERWTQLAEPYRAAARAAIERVAGHAGLSRDVAEIVDRALQAG